MSWRNSSNPNKADADYRADLESRLHPETATDSDAARIAAAGHAAVKGTADQTADNAAHRTSVLGEGGVAPKEPLQGQTLWEFIRDGPIQNQ